MLIKMLFLTVLSGPVIALLINFFLLGESRKAASYASTFIVLSFVGSLSLLVAMIGHKQFFLYSLFRLDALNLLLSTLILFISSVIHFFSQRYLDGDRLFSRYYQLLAAITLSCLLMVYAENLVLLWFFWSVSNGFLCLLIIHKKEWIAAKNAGYLVLTTLFPASIFLLIAVALLCFASNESSLHRILQYPFSPTIIMISTSFIALAALSQSALWPFHRWLINSLNSPTTVSAFMHAGIINGGGILIVKFAPLFLQFTPLLNLLFLLGAISALLGTLWKLMQHDVKRMLACSTLAQMGFMMMECGLGLFAAAIGHLCWHGLFKSYLFLNSGSALENRPGKSLEKEKRAAVLLPFAFLGGILAWLSFAFVTKISLSSMPTSSFFLLFTFITGSQLMLICLRSRFCYANLLLCSVLASLAGLWYGEIIHWTEWALPQLSALSTVKLSFYPILLMTFFFVAWLIFNLFPEKLSSTRLYCWCYLRLLNASRAEKSAQTAQRTTYRY